MRMNQLPMLLTAAWQDQIAVDIYGPPGVGKSEGVIQWAQQMARMTGKPFGVITEHLSTMESIDVRGIPVIVDEVQPDGTVAKRATFSKSPLMPSAELFPEGIPDQGVVFLDEYRQAPIDVIKPAARFKLERRIGNSSLDDYGHWFVITASNRTSDKSGANKGLAMDINRAIQVDIEPHLKSWLQWAENQDIHPLTVSYAQSHPGKVFLDEVPDKEGAFATPRTLVMADKFIRRFPGNDGMVLNFFEDDDFRSGVVMAGLAGLLGSVGVEFRAHCAIAHELPTLEEVVKDPTSAKMPERMDAKYAISQMLAFQIKPETAVPVFTYITRIPNEELQVASLRQAMKRAPTIGSHPQFLKWVEKNSSLLLTVAQAA